MIIVTHVSPDLDAIGGCWLLQRYGGMQAAVVQFVNTSNPDRAQYDAADAVVDTGQELDPLRLRFDHHHLPGAEQRSCSATSLVYQWLKAQATDDPSHLEWLGPLINLIEAGDTGRRDSGADWSRTVGIHALLSAKKAQRVGDAALLAYGYAMLDGLDARLKARARARATLEQHTVYRSDDGLVVALRDAPQGATHAAFEAGARLVAFQSSYTLADGSATHAIGVMRAGEWTEPDVGDMVREMLASSGLTEEQRDELNIWFLHPAGFFAGRGTQKAPSTKPVLFGAAQVAAYLDAAWRRP